jgi:hypothetical protein
MRVGLKKKENFWKEKDRGNDKGYETESKKRKSHQKRARHLSQGAGISIKVHRNVGTSKDCCQINEIMHRCAFMIIHTVLCYVFYPLYFYYVLYPSHF